MGGAMGAGADAPRTHWTSAGPEARVRPGVHIDLLPLFGALLAKGQDAKPVYTVFFIVGKEFSVL